MQTSFNDHFYYILWWTASLAERGPSVLVASDVAAHGLDFYGVDHVIFITILLFIILLSCEFIMGCLDLS